MSNRKCVLDYFEQNKDFFEDTVYPNIEKYRKGDIKISVTDKSGNNIPAICSMFKIRTNLNGWGDLGNGEAGIRNGTFRLKETAYSDAQAFTTAVTGQKLVYELATPVTIPLTAEQVGAVITTFKGNNNVWADTGDVSLDYRADTKKYIDKKLAELVAQIVNS